jgi:hypothetical protein
MTADGMVGALLAWVKIMERETGFEPATSTLEGWHSTTELLPQPYPHSHFLISGKAR